MIKKISVILFLLATFVFVFLPLSMGCKSGYTLIINSSLEDVDYKIIDSDQNALVDRLLRVNDWSIQGINVLDSVGHFSFKTEHHETGFYLDRIAYPIPIVIIEEKGIQVILEPENIISRFMSFYLFLLDFSGIHRLCGNL